MGTFYSYYDEETKAQIAGVTCSWKTEGPGSTQPSPGV